MPSLDEGIGSAAGIEITVEHADGVPVVRVVGDVDLATAPQLDAILNQFSGEQSRLVVDLRDVSFLDSSGLSVLVQCRQRLTQGSDRSMLTLVVNRPSIQRVLEVTGLDQVFEITNESPAELREA